MEKHFRSRRWHQMMVAAVRQGDPGEEMTWREFAQCVLMVLAGVVTLGIALAVLGSIVLMRWLAWRIVADPIYP